MKYRIRVEVTLTPDALAAFHGALTGDDNDVRLAIEHCIGARLGGLAYPDVSVDYTEEERHDRPDRCAHD